MMTEELIAAIENRVSELTPDGFGMSIGGNQQVVDIFFATLPQDQVDVIKQDLKTNFPDSVSFT
jgi:hypothetical protein